MQPTTFNFILKVQLTHNPQLKLHNLQSNDNPTPSFGGEGSIELGGGVQTYSEWYAGWHCSGASACICSTAKPTSPRTTNRHWPLLWPTATQRTTSPAPTNRWLLLYHRCHYIGYKNLIFKSKTSKCVVRRLAIYKWGLKKTKRPALGQGREAGRWGYCFVNHKKGRPGELRVSPNGLPL